MKNSIKTYLEDKKVKDILTINTKEKTPFFDQIIIGTCLNNRHLNSLKNAITQFLKENKINLNHIEGSEESGWVIIDAFEIIIHLFTKDERKRINLESIFN